MFLNCDLKDRTYAALMLHLAAESRITDVGRLDEHFRAELRKVAEAWGVGGGMDFQRINLELASGQIETVTVDALYKRWQQQRKTIVDCHSQITSAKTEAHDQRQRADALKKDLDAVAQALYDWPDGARNAYAVHDLLHKARHLRSVCSAVKDLQAKVDALEAKNATQKRNLEAIAMVACGTKDVDYSTLADKVRDPRKDPRPGDNLVRRVNGYKIHVDDVSNGKITYTVTTPSAYVFGTDIPVGTWSRSMRDTDVALTRDPRTDPQPGDEWTVGDYPPLVVIARNADRVSWDGANGELCPVDEPVQEFLKTIRAFTLKRAA